MHSALQYAHGTSDPNQMRVKDFIEGKKPNYYLIRSTADNGLASTYGEKPNYKFSRAERTIDNRPNPYNIPRFEVPNVKYSAKNKGRHSSRPGTAYSVKSYSSKKDHPEHSRRFNEQTSTKTLLVLPHSDF